MAIDALARSIAQLGPRTQRVGGRIAVLVTDAQAACVVDLSVAGGRWTEGVADDADCAIVGTRRALRAFGDPEAFRAALDGGELAVLGAVDKLQALVRMIEAGPGWARELRAAAA